jgi:hypothetical protein
MPATLVGSRLEAMRALTIAMLGLAAAALTWRLRPGTGGEDPVGEIVLGCAWLAWLLAGWLALAVAGCAMTRLRGDRRTRYPRWIPPRLGRLVDLVISAGLVGVLLGGTVGPASATTMATLVNSAAHSAPGSPLQWPGLPVAGSDGQRDTHPQAAVPRTRRHAQAPVRLVTTAPHRAVGDDDLVTVRRGDSLWSLVAARLGPRATDARIATEWPRWYAANRQVIGPDPSVIHPGQQLRPPPPRPPGSSR